MTGGNNTVTRTSQEYSEFNAKYTELFTLIRKIEPAINACMSAFASNAYERNIITLADRRESKITAREASQSHMDAVAASRATLAMWNSSKKTRSHRRNNSPMGSSSLPGKEVPQSNRITRTIRQTRSRPRSTSSR